MCSHVKLSQTGGLASGAVESLHCEKRSEGAPQGHEPEHLSQGVPAFPGMARALGMRTECAACLSYFSALSCAAKRARSP